MISDTTLSREAVISAISRNHIIAILRGVPQAQLLPVAQALYDGGIRLLELTYSADGKVSDEETAAGIASLAQVFAGKMVIGAGTVLTARQVAMTAQAGGRFIISPNADETVIRATRAQDLVSIPGAMTPTEIQNAHLWGADFVKLFPAAALGPGYIKAICAPLSHIRLLAVGGITAENIPDYLRAGVCGFGVSSNIVREDALAREDYAAITALARRYTDACAEEGTRL